MFDLLFYGNFYLDLQKLGMNDEKLEKHYHTNGKNEGMWCCEEDFYKEYPTFDLEFYNYYYEDLFIFANGNKYALMRHYHTNGKNEGRWVCEEDFYKEYPTFDLEFYNYYYEDSFIFANGNKYVLMRYYHTTGKKEGMLCCEEDFYKEYPTFDLEFYNHYNADLYKIFGGNKYALMRHYHTNGKNEGRIICEEDFYKEYPTFDLEFYRFNNDLPIFANDNKYELMNHYHTTGKYQGRWVCEEDFTKKCFNSNTIFHILHNLAGGTEIYVYNLINIYNNYTHILIKIIGDFYVEINKKKFHIDYLSKLFENNSNTVFLHHLLYINNNNSLSINDNVSNILINNKYIKKILIIHDYFLLFNQTPNPVKSKNLIPAIENIEETNKIFNCFNKVIFNSENCYLNYKKYINPINNAIILNNVPDIDYYNIRCFPRNKNTYNIGIIGYVMNHEHKGKILFKKIIDSYNNNTKYKFIVFGENNYNDEFNYSNIICTGKYENSEIFNLINEKDIDFFLFLSTFEETYSFTLSIALKFGLPIIYNNIGSYTERLSSYKNCFPFIEDDYMEIHNIINNIENNFINDKNVKPFEYDNMVLYKNIPELSEYLRHDDELNFDLSTIQNNLINKNVCFIAFSNIDDNCHTYKNILYDQLNYIKSSGLYDKLDYIFITMLGEYTKIVSDYKIKVIYYSPDIYEWEFSNYKRIKYFCDNIPFNVNILEIHIKGAQKKLHSYEWRKYLEYFLIEKHELCLDLLENYKCVGVNQQFYFDEVNKYRNHFSGNFWWSRSDHIKKLPLIGFNEDRCVVEHWLIGNLYKYDYRNFLSLHHTDYNLYQTSILPEEYNMEIIKSAIINNIEKQFMKTIPIYGVYFICCLGNYLTIIEDQIQKLMQSGLYDETDMILCFVCIQTDECLNILKKYDKIKIISTNENLYEKFAINNYKNYLQGEYYLYYIHSKGVSKSSENFENWRCLCDYFTIHKWRLNIELLKYYDCVGTNLKNFPKKHFSGNFWWSKSEHLNKLKNINYGYLSCEMYLLSCLKTNYVSLYQSYTHHGYSNYPINLYINKTDMELINNICIVPDFNIGDKQCIVYCDNIDLSCEPPILEFN
jgi:hypothetical protein